MECARFCRLCWSAIWVVVGARSWGTRNAASHVYYGGPCCARQAATQDISGHYVASQKQLPKNTRLDSWKAIAAYFGKDERTVKRWEKERGLPIRRLPGAARGTVFAYTLELESWLEGSESQVAEEAPQKANAIGEVARQAPVSEFVVREQGEIATGRRKLWPRVLLWAVPLVLLAFFFWYSSVGHHELRFGNALAAHHLPDATAQDFYLKGRFYFEKRTSADLNTAVDAFTQAIVHDPNYAQAYVGLADTYSLLREYGSMPTPDAEQRARAAAQKAVELDPNLAEAHTSLAFAEFWGSLDAAGADREFRRAIELNPNLARAHHWYATFLTQVLRDQDALAQIERARQLDPGSKAILADKAVLLYNAGHEEEALALLKQMQASDPSFRSVHAYLGTVYWEEHNYAIALEEQHKDASIRGNDKVLRNVEAQQAALQTGGVQGLFQYRLETALQAYQQDNGSAYAVASSYGYLKKRDEVMKYLQLARQSHDLGLTDVELARELGWLHSDPEFRKLVIDIGFPPLP